MWEQLLIHLQVYLSIYLSIYVILFFFSWHRLVFVEIGSITAGSKSLFVDWESIFPTHIAARYHLRRAYLERGWKKKRIAPVMLFRSAIKIVGYCQWRLPLQVQENQHFYTYYANLLGINGTYLNLWKLTYILKNAGDNWRKVLFFKHWHLY